MPRRDLDCAAAKLGIGMVVRNNWDQPPGDWQAHILPHQRLVTIILRVHRDRHIGEHRFGPRRRDRDEPAAILKRVFEMPKLPVHLTRFDLKV